MLLCQPDPSLQRDIVRKQVQGRLISSDDISRVSGEGDPSERPASLAKKRTYVCRHEAGKRIRVLYASLMGQGTDIIAVVEHHCTGLLKRQHGLNVSGYRIKRALRVLYGLLSAQCGGFLQRETGRDVSVERIVRRRLIRHDIRDDTVTDEFLQYLRAVPDRPDRKGPPSF